MDPKIHGKHGDFLASIATLSLLSISSQHRRYLLQNSILIHNSTTLSRHLPAPVEQHLRAFDCGTRVIVRDLFGSMPVRVKQRAMLTSERFYLDKAWGQLIADMVAVLLAWPSDISVSLRDSVSQREVKLRPPETADITARTSRLTTQASMANSSDADGWVPLSASAGNVSVKGCISASPVATRSAQFISIGIRPFTNEHGTNVVYEEINRVFINSSFGALEEGSERQPKDLLSKHSKSRKGVNRWPMFYFQLRLRDSSSHSIDEVMDDRNNELAVITDLLKATCYSFLKKHHHRPRKVRLSTEESVLSTSKALDRAKVTPLKRTLSAVETRSSSPSVLETSKRVTKSASPFDDWQRVKVGHATKKIATPKDLLWGQFRTKSTICEKERFIGEGGVLLRKPFDELDDEACESTLSSSHFGTSASTPALGFREGPPQAPEGTLSTTSQPSQRIGLKKPPKAEPSGWIKEIVENWDNPVFETPPLAVPRAYGDVPPPVADPRLWSRSDYFKEGAEECGIKYESNSVSQNGRISKSALMKAEVVSQVDLKFILVKLPLYAAIDSSAEKLGSMALVMLDQHAVDERCQLEDLMASYFVLQPDGTLSANVECLEQPLKYEVREQDAHLLAGLQAHFSTWGIVFNVDVKRTSRSEPKHTIKVTHLPPSIVQRCLTEPYLLINLMRTEAHTLSRPPLSPQLSSSQHPWVSYFHDCPRGILDLLYSRSCRSAIMFNDVLSLEECEELVQRVSRCAFPFQCAHGRPSMVPVLDLGSSKGAGKLEGKGVDWKGWMEIMTA